MYVILINDDNTMTTTISGRIVQRSNLVDDLCFLVNPFYNGIDMSSATVLLEYVAPVSRKYQTEFLVVEPQLHKGYLKYKLPFDTKLTQEAGDIEIQISFIYVDMGLDGKAMQRVRKTAPAHKIAVIPISAWSDIIPDSALSALDQRIIKMDAQMKAMEDMNKQIYDAKADNIRYDEDSNKLQLMAGENTIGDVVQLKTCKNDEDGVPVVDFSTIKDDNTEQPSDFDNVVEF